MGKNPKLWMSLIVAMLCALALAGCSGGSGGQPSDDAISLEDIPAYSGTPYVEINDNIPDFTVEELSAKPGTEEYGKLDSLGRCTETFANVGLETMPTEKRGDISEIHPTGWKQNFYPFVEQEALYNRSHLIGYQLTAENANERNLITGTRYMNADGMEPFESMIAQYVKRSKNHVIYRVVPVFEGSNLLASGVHMVAQSVEDKGRGISFNIYCYNVQPGVGIDYKTGKNWSDKSSNTGLTNNNPYNSSNGYKPSSSSSYNSGSNGGSSANSSNASKGQVMTYVLNTSSMKFHLPACQGVQNMSASNKKTVKDTRDNLVKQGYAPCGSCNP